MLHEIVDSSRLGAVNAGTVHDWKTLHHIHIVLVVPSIITNSG